MSRVQIISLHAWVNYDLEWKDAAMRAAPETDPEGIVLRLGHCYPTEKQGMVLEQCRIIGFGRPITAVEVLRDRRVRKMNPAHPRICLAVGERYRRLPRKFGRACIDLATLAICHYHVPRVPVLTYWSDGRRTADVGRPDWPWDDSVFFVFGCA